MAKGFTNVSMGADDLVRLQRERSGGPLFAGVAARDVDLEGIDPDDDADVRELIAAAPPVTDEVAARGYLDLACASPEAGTAERAVRAEDLAELVPSLQLQEIVTSPLSDNRVVRFVQSHGGVPVEGARATVELAADQTPVNLDLGIADPEVLDRAGTVASISPERAIEAVLDHTNNPGDRSILSSATSPTLAYVPTHDGADDGSEAVAGDGAGFALAYVVRGVAAAPPEDPTVDDGIDDEMLARLASVGGWEGPGAGPGVYDYVVDATTGDVLQALPASRSAALPVKCKGVDEHATPRDFIGSRDAGRNVFVMDDPVRDIVTVDFDYEVYDVQNPPPLPPAVSNPTSSWGTTNTAAVSAHHNATVVSDFFEQVLHRDGIDGKGMRLVSFVNTVDTQGATEYANAFWFGSRMVYGQTRDGSGDLVSVARYLDVMAHELTHGITEATAKLVYRSESGALNESISDIFGVIVQNQGQPVGSWSWAIGQGWNPDGSALRDLEDPARGRQPAHMDQWEKLPVTSRGDWGGVHLNSGIHNHAAYRVLTATLPGGRPALDPADVASCYYQALLRLNANATFRDCRDQLIVAADALFAGDPDRQDRLAAITDAYAAVGIT